MDCTEFVARFSEYLDGTGPEQLLREAEEHEASCPSCQRYRRVTEEGAALLRQLPGVDVREDFRSRLQHRLYHVDYESSVQRRGASGATALTTLGMAVLLAVAAWSPTLRHDPVVRLDPIVVTEPAQRPRSTSLFTTGSLLSSSHLREWKRGLWEDAHELLYEYSPIRRRYQEQQPVREARLGQNP